MFPEYVGLRCIDGVIKLFDGQKVEVRDVTPTVPMTAESLEKYYPKKTEFGHRILKRSPHLP